MLSVDKNTKHERLEFWIFLNLWKPRATTQSPDYKDKNRYFELSPHAFTLGSQGGAPGDDQSGQTEDEDAAADNGEAEIVEHHGRRLHQVAHQHGEHLGSQGAADDEGCADLDSNNAQYAKSGGQTT